MLFHLFSCFAFFFFAAAAVFTFNEQIIENCAHLWKKRKKKKREVFLVVVDTAVSIVVWFPRLLNWCILVVWETEEGIRGRGCKEQNSSRMSSKQIRVSLENPSNSVDWMNWLNEFK